MTTIHIEPPAGQDQADDASAISAENAGDAVFRSPRRGHLAAQVDGEPTEPATPTDGTTDPATDGTDPAGEPDTFPRSYVEQLRKESAGYRVQAQRADDLHARLLAATVASSAGSVLADPADLLTFGTEPDLLDEQGYPDPGRIATAAQALATARPHLASRRPSGNAGQGARSNPEQVDLAAILRARAG